MEKFLITGGQGFIGAWVARLLVEQDVSVTALGRTPNNGILSQVVEPDALREVQREFGDVVDHDRLRSSLEENEITHIVHLAGLQTPACQRFPVEGARVNVVGTVSVFEAARSLLDQCRMIVYSSSAAVAGSLSQTGRSVRDEDHHIPKTQYGVFKLANEGSARIYWEEHGMPSVGLRPAVVYGVGRELGLTSAVTKAIKSAVLGRPFTIPFIGPMNLVFVEDLARIVIQAARSGVEGAPCLNIRGTISTVEAFVELLGEMFPETGGRIDCRGDPLPFVSDFDESGLAQLFADDILPCTPLRRGIERCVEQYARLGRTGRLHDRDL